MALTAQDRTLVALLTRNARESTAALARKLGVARSTVQARIARLEAAGVIAGYTVRLGGEYRRGLIRAHVLITLDPKRAGEAEAALKRMPEFTALYSVSGAHDLIAVAAAETTEDMDALLDRIRKLGGVTATNSSILLSAKLER
ncbi:MAG: Lrp/AsnC family transcriptional regulator [Alphaproteobacteria bacterium]